MFSPLNAQRNVRAWSCSILGILILAITVLAASAAQAAINKGRVYYGDPYDFSVPGEIRAYDVFNSISEFKMIKQKNIRPSDAEYWILMRRANRKFRLALKKISNKLEFDLIGEVGFIKIDLDVQDITIPVILEINAMQRSR